MADSGDLTAPEAPPRSRPTPRGALVTSSLLLALYFGSGLAAGVLLSAGLRAFSLTAGWTASASLAAVVGMTIGAALGATIVSRWLDHRPAPAAILAFLQAGLGLAVLASTGLFLAARSAYLVLWPLLGGTEPGGWFLRALLSLCLFGLPAGFALGMPPALVRLVASGRRGFGIALGFTFGLSLASISLGLVTGTALLLPALGTKGGLLIGAALAGLTAAGTVLVRQTGLEGPGSLGVLLSSSPEVGWTGTSLQGERPADGLTAGGTLAAAVTLFGFSVWVYLIVWSRTLTFIVGGTAAAKAIVAAVFLLGMAVGAFLVAGLAERIASPSLALTVLAATASLVAYASVFLVPQASVLYLRLTPLLARGPTTGLIATALTATTLLLPSTLFLGAALPLLPLAAGAKRRPMITSVGFLAVGVILADVTVRMLVVPAFGLRWSVSLAAAVGLLSAILFVGGVTFQKPALRTTVAFSLLVLMVILGGFPVAWDPRLVASGLYRLGPRSLERYGSPAGFLAARRSIEVVFYREGRNASVVIERNLQTTPGVPPSEALALTIDGRVSAATGQDLRTQILLGHIPLLVHGPTESVLLVDFLNGVAAGSILRHPIKSLKVIEREPILFEAASRFSDYNHSAQEDPRIEKIADSARAGLLIDQDLYDVIVLAGMDPWLPHSASQCTSEGYALLKSHLRPSGLVAQRLPLPVAGEAALLAIMRTFARAFESVLVFQISPDDLLLLGSSETLAIDVGWLRNVVRSSVGVGEDLGRALATGPNEIVMAFRLGTEQIRALVGEGPTNDDDRASVEAASARHLTVHRNEPLLAAIDRAWGGVLPFLKNYGALPQEKADFLYNLAKSYLGVAGDYDRAQEIARELAGMGRTGMARWVSGECLLQQADVSGALGEWQSVLETDPGNLDALFSLGTYHVDNHDYFEAETYLSRAVRLFPAASAIRYHHGRNLFYLGRHAEAVEELRQAREQAGPQESYPLVDYFVGVAALKLRRDAEAVEALQAYLKWAYEQSTMTRLEVDAHLKLAEIYERQGKRFAAHKERQKGEELLRKIETYTEQMRGSPGPGLTRRGASPQAPEVPEPVPPDGS